MSALKCVLLIIAAVTGGYAAESAEIDFRYRFYYPANCDHSSPAISTWPRNNLDPLQGTTGNCYSAPVGTDWQRLEIDKSFGGSRAVITFCNVDCQGSSSTIQRDTHCFVPVPGCAIGSFLVGDIVNGH